MTRDSFHRLLKKARDRQSWVAPRKRQCLSLRLGAALVCGKITATSRATLVETVYAFQIHFVCLLHGANPARQQFQGFSQPRKIVLQRNFTAIAQHSKKPAFHRWPRHQSSIQIKERRDSCAMFLGSHSFPHAASGAARDRKSTRLNSSHVEIS